MNVSPAAPLASPMPLTEAQDGLWYAQALDPQNPILNTGQYLELLGPLDRAALAQAVARTIAEAPALSLRFADTAEGPRQSSGLPPMLGFADLSAQPDAEGQALALMRADSNRPLDLARDPAAAFTLFALGHERHFLYERIHHLAIDGYGMVLVTNRIAAHYSALTGQGPEPMPFASMAAAFQDDAEYRASPRRQADRDWWHQRLAGLPEVTGPAGGRALTGHGYLRSGGPVPATLCALLQRRAGEWRLGWPDMLNALAGAYLARWTAGEVVIGLPYMARMGRRSADLPCMAMNVLPHPLRPDEDAPLPDWLAAQSKSMAQGRRHGLYRSELLRRELGLVGGSRRLYGPIVNVQPFDRPPRFPGLDCRLHILGAGAVDDLTLTFRGDPETGMIFEVDGNPGLYNAEEIEGHAARLPAFIEAALVAGSLAPVPTASPDEVAAIRARAMATQHALPDTTLTALIDATLAHNPDAPAVTAAEGRLTYAELDRRSAALAARLVAHGAGRDRIVAVSLERGLDLPVALLAVLRAGAAYLPLDPTHPPERIARILTLADPVAVLAGPGQEALFPPGTPLLRPDDWPVQGACPYPDIQPGNMAYVIFTSGSTGEPKGVVIEHRAIVNRLMWMQAHYGVDASDRILQKTPATFDVSVWEFFLPMIAGAELVMAPPGAHRDPAAIAALIRDHGVTTCHFVPSMLSAFLASPASDGLEMRRVFCSGEELTADQRDRFHARIASELHNLYGPTEAAVDVSYWPAGPQDTANPVPIGFPVWNTALEVLDDRLRPVPAGLAGHLYLGGVQLARGYLGRPDLSAERFLHLPQGRRYATGDLARLRPDGAVTYLGRLDHQVKIRGLRIELGEIEAAIMASGLAREAVVLARADHGGDKRLVAYLVPAPEWRPGLLAERLAASLPGYMIPAAEVALDALPVTGNGKLDRKALPEPAFEDRGRGADTPAERLLAELFARILHLPAPASAEADFFALGGDSLSAVRLAQEIQVRTGRDPGLGTIFEHPVLSALAAHLQTDAAPDDGLGPLILLADGDPEAAPLFLIHPAGGLSWGYRHLARLIGPERRVYGLQHPGLDPKAPLADSLSALAQDYVLRIAALVPQGPLHLAGWSVGGILAQEMALALAAMGRRPGLVAVLDSYPADAWRNEPEPDPVAALRALLAIAGHDPEAHPELDSRDKVVDFLRAGDSALGALPEPVLDGVIRTVTGTNRLIRAHRHRRWPGQLLHFRAARDHQDRDLSPEMWRAYVEGLEVIDLPLLHAEMTSDAASAVIGPELARRMRQAHPGV
ncbi:amino acid adenylation domain-containing protein [Paracoccus limosus]|uniref:Amino acid adenylation domain-containing protein n=1 Tax=Paracoccus limosus TaxID=913252 RepID=A0A844H4I5_9RHOB|nr:non-ribosomal peptide synthetase [Paracoccus limosus]MTH34464.1 amino acid adenylation domain-containing protein [Paracoccus limosus]